MAQSFLISTWILPVAAKANLAEVDSHGSCCSEFCSEPTGSNLSSIYPLEGKGGKGAEGEDEDITYSNNTKFSDWISD